MTPLRRGWVGLLLAVVSCADLRDPTVVTIGSETWTLKDLRRAYAELTVKWRIPLGAPEAREAFVDRLIDRRLLAEYADSILTAENDPRTAWQDTAEGILLRRLRVIAGAGVLPTEEDVTEAVRRMGLRTRIERMQFPDEASARHARDRILAGSSFAAAAAGGAGVLLEEEWLAWQPNASEVAERAASLAVGEVSEVFRAGFVDCLVRPLERAPVDSPPPDYNEVARGLQARKAAEAVDELVESLRAAAAVRVDDDTIGLLTRGTIESILGASSIQHDADWAIPQLPEAAATATVCEWRGGRLSGEDYVNALRNMTPAHRPSGTFLRRRVRAAAESEVSRRLLLDEARRRGLETDPWAVRALRRAREEYEVRFAVTVFTERVAVKPAEIDSVRSFLEEVPVPMFRKEDRALVLRYDLPSREAAGAEIGRIRAAGGGWKRLDELFAGDPAFVGTFQLLSLTERGTPEAELTSAALDPFGPSLVGPLPVGGNWVVLDRLELEPGRPMTEEEIRKTLEERIRQERSRDVREAWLAHRRRERGVTVDTELLDALSPGG